MSEDTYLDKIPIELLKIIFDFLEDDDLKIFYESRYYFGSNICIIYQDYMFWLNRLKRQFSNIDNPTYIIDIGLFEKYIKLKNIILNWKKTILQIYESFASDSNVILSNIKLHELPYYYITKEIRSKIKDFYIDSLDYGVFIRGYDGKFYFEGYTLSISINVFGFIKYYMSINKNDNNEILKIRLKDEDAYNLLALIEYNNIQQITL